jgi:hypothetical protein
MIPRFELRLFRVTIWICRWRIAKIFSRRISQSDCSIQIKLNYSNLIKFIAYFEKKFYLFQTVMVSNSPVQYQQNKQSPLTTYHEHKRYNHMWRLLFRFWLGGCHTCGGVKLCRWIPPFLITGSPPTTQIDANIKYLDIFASTEKDHTLSQIFMTT